jgi:hypothetical protein
MDRAEGAASELPSRGSLALGATNRLTMSLGQGRSHHVVQAVDDRGLERLLSSLGVLETIGVSARCARCGQIVTLETIAAVYPEDDQVRFLCTNGRCINAMELPADD